MSALFTSLADDLRYAIRITMRNRRFTLLVLVALALGIGINTAVFAVLRAVVLRPLPYERSGALTMIWSAFQKMGASRAPGAGVELREIQRNSRLYEGVAGIWVGSGTLTGKAEPQQIKVGFVTWNFFNVLGAHPARGRWFGSGDEGNGRRAAISDQRCTLASTVWRRPTRAGSP